jgi:hypothetical protein
MKRASQGSIIRGAIKRSQYSSEEVFRMCSISRGAFYRKCQTGKFTLAEIGRLNKAVHFMDEELIELCGGRQ